VINTDVGITSVRVNGCLVVNLPPVFSPSGHEDLRDLVLKTIERSGIREVIFEMSAMVIIDVKEFSSVCRVGQMARLLGAFTSLSGMRPEAAAYLAASELHTDGFNIYRELDNALDSRQRGGQPVS